MTWQKITIVGVGLLGGSLGSALRQRSLARRVVGFVRRPESVEECLQSGVVDEATQDLGEAVGEAELVVLCTPIAQMKDLVDRMCPALAEGTVVTDVGSVKGWVVDQLEPLIRSRGAYFVGSHPMAGGERMGVGAARPDLFHEALSVITPTDRSHEEAVRQTESLWRSVGAQLMRLTPELHDALVARSSHLPHLLSAALANFVLDPSHPKEQSQLCANGFRDTTRIASGSPEMWRDIALANQGNLSHALSEFLAEIRAFQQSLDEGDRNSIETFFHLGKQRRDQWCGRTRSSEE